MRESMKRLGRMLLFLRSSIAIAAALAGSGSPVNLGFASTAPIRTDFGKLPLSFEPNQGQAPAAVQFLARSRGMNIYFTSTGFLLRVRGDRVAKAIPLKMTLAGASSNAAMTGLDELQGKSNYFVGSNPRNWHTDIPNYSRILSRRVYSGIDLIYHGNRGRLEYDFVASPGSRPQAISMMFQGAEKIERGSQGSLLVRTSKGTLTLARPIAYQEIEGERRLIRVSYILTASERISFRLGNYDPRFTLTIDPTLGYSTYLGGSGNDEGHGIVADAAGNVYVTGSTESIDFPLVNPFDKSWGGTCGPFTVPCSDVFVSKLNAAGTVLIYSTYLGGSDIDVGQRIAVDSAGSAFVTGYTSSTNFPVVSGAVQPTQSGGIDAFVTKLSPSGSSLVYSTYLGGSLDDEGMSIGLDSSGNAYITGYTRSTDFRTTPSAFRTTLTGEMDVFVTKLDASGSNLIYSTYLGGTGGFLSLGDADEGFDIAVDSSGNAYVAGTTKSSDFPTTPGAYQTTGGALLTNVGFVTKLNAAGSGLVYSTYLGDGFETIIYGIALDSGGNAYVAGVAKASTFATPGAYQTSCGDFLHGDGFVAKFNSSASGLVYATCLGGSSSEVAYGIAVDGSGNAWVAGATNSSDFPVSSAIQSALGGGIDAFVSQINSTGSSLLFSTYLGGSSDDEGLGIAIGPSNKVFVTGMTKSTNFPTTAKAFRGTLSGISNDAFITQIDAGATPSSYTLYFPRLVSTPRTQEAFDDSEYTGIAVVNLDTVNANVKFTALDTTGTPITGTGINNPVTYIIKPANQLVKQDFEFFGTGLTAPNRIGWIKAESSTQKVTGFFVAYNGSLTIMDGADVSGRTMSSFVLPEIENPEGSGFTQIHIANPNSGTATLSVSIIRPGQSPSQSSYSVPGNAVKVIDSVDLLPSDYIRITSDRPLVPLEFFGRNTPSAQYVQALNGQDVSLGATTLYAPQYAVGGGWRSNLSVINLSSTASGNVTFKLYDNSGNLIRASQPQPMAPLAKIYISSQDFFVNPGSNTTQGYVEVSSDGIPLAGSIVFGDAAGMAYATALPLVSQLQTSMILGQMVSNSVYYTGLAIINPSSTSVNVTIQAYDQSGQSLVAKPYSVELPAKQRIIGVLSYFFPGLSESVINSGYIRITASQGVAAFAVYGTNGGTILSAVPAQTVP